MFANTSSANKSNNMFSKKRPLNSAIKIKDGDEDNKEGNSSALDSLFASAPAERPSHLS